MDIKLITQMAIYSAILGAGLAVLAAIPAFAPVITLFVLPFLAAPIVFCTMLYRKDMTAESLEMKGFAIYGGGIGVVCGAAFLAVFCPLVLLIHLIFKTYYAYGVNFLNLFLIFILFFSIACVFLITNAASGLLTGFLAKQFFKKMG